MNLTFSEHGYADYLYWQETDRQRLKRINALIRSTLRTPFEGLGEPELLKHELSGLWSRRIDARHRMVYRVDEDGIYIVALRFHYEG